MQLVKEADSVELKTSVPESEQRSAVRALGLDPLVAQIRQVYFFDTPDLRLDAHGLIVRARRVARRGDDTVVKLRPVDPERMSSGLRHSADFGVEVDAMPGGFVCSGSLKGAPSRAEVRQVAAGKAPIRKLFTKPQRKLFAEHAPDGLELDDLSLLGPIFVLKFKWPPMGYDRKLVVELWLYPDDSRILELSTRCAPHETFDVATETRSFLTDSGVELSGEQAPKTRRALDFFSRQLQDST